MLLSGFLNTVIKHGALTIIDAHGKTQTFTGTASPKVTIRLHDPKLEYKLYLNPDLALGEAYMNETLTIESGTLREFAEIVGSALGFAPNNRLFAARSWIAKQLRRYHQRNPVGLSRRNVKHHYDLPDELYDLFLDEDKQYSCGYFYSPDDDLSTAQLAKKRHLAAKLRLEPGQRVLDIGSGWGGLGLYLAQVGGGDVTGLTLSDNQLKIANQRVRGAGLDDRVRFELRDYRNEKGKYDRIVSVGMFEHVGIGNFKAYFDAISRLLTDDGIAVVHSIGRRSGPGRTSSWIRKYIFPGGYIPSLSETLAAVEKNKLWVTDVEILRLHYAETLKAWYERFQANRDTVAAMMDERFCRMWELYLALSEAQFRYDDLMVFQIQITKNLGVVPVTRDYITDFERAQNADANVRKPSQVA